MLPGFRFLFAAIVLSMSVLVFGLGAAALLRASHEQFASLPSRRPPPEPVFVRQNEAPVPTLALLRVEPDVAEKVPDNVAATNIETATPAAQAPEAPPAEPEKTAALKLDEPVKLNEAAPAETVKAEIPTAETIPAVQAEMPAAETPAAKEVEAPAAKMPAANEEVKLAAIAETPPPATSATSTVTAPVVETPSLEGNLAALKIATLGGPAVAIQETASVKPAAAKPERSVNRKRAQRAKERRRIIAARRALQARQVAQQAADPFAQLTSRGR
ncbi:hypothetical protein [Bradyrhizobium sp. AUGA SZCCT0182]|uniref:hypothetical protein n=1 Tax=Bradyrhizobium sp. AUGA SZCCT0182 TaxID=2807667 RepID=UPI001BA5D64F|nr:hypothetical protein [Bradyrhizobium sp. AUGA SZCCT0182]MBR1230525.1 hypothetical protein [Bradyrhizobium sp. AUGA SZCCT0182]